MPVSKSKGWVQQKVGTFYDVYSGPQHHYVSTYEGCDIYEGNKGHYGYPDFPPGLDVGGGFKMAKFTYNPAIIPVGSIYGSGPWHNDHYDGSVAGHCPWAGWSTINDSGPAAWGAEAYAKMKPSRPSFSALNSIYELRELPSLIRQKFLDKGINGIASYWLAQKFGWDALLSDIRNLVQTQMDAQKRLAQLLRDNGRPVRRRIVLRATSDLISETEADDWGWYTPGLNTYFFRLPPRARTKEEQFDLVWASAQFRYFLPPGPQDVQYRRSLMHKLYGVQFPSPSQIYNAIPWSWLVDWFSNLGYLIENLDPGVADRTAAEYFYVMRTMQRKVTKDHAVHYWQGIEHTPKSYHGTSTSSASWKIRTRGDPFGFATNQNDLNATQLSILGALGLSRLR